MSSMITQPQGLVQVDDTFSLRLDRKPEAVIAEARIAANALMEAVKKNNWAQRFGNREHLFFEAWAFLANMYRVVPRVRETRFVQFGEVQGYEAVAEAVHIPTQTVIGTAESMCLDDEDNWDLRAEYAKDRDAAGNKVKIGDKPVPLFQLRSMAQTRSMSRCLKAPFSWVIAMAGYAPTGAEDMSGPRQKQADSNANAGGVKINEKQAKRIWAIGFGAKMSSEDIKAFIKAHGFDKADDITLDKYEEVVKALEDKIAGKTPAQQQQTTAGNQQGTTTAAGQQESLLNNSPDALDPNPRGRR